MPLPFVLAGPVLRRVEPRRVTVWVALSQDATVDLDIWDGIQASTGIKTVASGEARLHGQRVSTKALGDNLHIALAALEIPQGQTPLGPGRVYSYDLTFQNAGGTRNLRSEGLLRDGAIVDADPAAPANLALGYDDDQLPSFATAPMRVESLKIAYGSCRKTTAQGEDAMAWIDGGIENKRDLPDERLHQLFLVGDQIYADDVAGPLLVRLTEVGNELMGAARIEKLPVGSGAFDATADNFPAGSRQKLCFEVAKLSTVDGTNQLLSFAEYAAMYLHAWSPAVWRPLPTEMPGLNNAPVPLKEKLTDWEGCLRAAPSGAKKAEIEKKKEAAERSFTAQGEAVAGFRDAVSKVRRLLANVPTYMIFDDHEVTDDWNITKDWVDRVMTSPLGVTVVRNALVAYGIFQAWGNDPKAFSQDDNKTFLEKSFALFGSSGIDTDARDEIHKLLGLGGAAPKVKWHFTVDGPQHRVVALDVRTRREYATRFSPPRLISSESLKDQIPAGPFTDGKELLILLSPPPVVNPPLIDQILHPIGSTLIDMVAVSKRMNGDFGVDECSGRPVDPFEGPEYVDVESWFADEKGFEALLARLAPYKKVLILSGDVHFATSYTIDYWKGSEKARFVQMTSSGARNRWMPIVRALFSRFSFLQGAMKGLIPAERLGWNAKDPRPITSPLESTWPSLRARLRRSPVVAPVRGWPDGTTQARDPDWAWRIDMLIDRRQDSDRPAEVRPQSIATPLDPAHSRPGYSEVLGRHADAASHHVHTRAILFLYNIGVVSFEMNGGLTVREELLSRHPDAPTADPAPNTVHEASLEVTTADRPRIGA